jgi:hypothetical protein
MSLLRLNGLYFMEYGDQTAAHLTRLFRFYAKDFKLVSLQLAGDINKHISSGIAQVLSIMDSNPEDNALITSKYQLDENYQLKFKLNTEEFHGSLSIDNSYISLTLNSPKTKNKTPVYLERLDLANYIKLKELGEPYSFDFE